MAAKFLLKFDASQQNVAFATFQLLPIYENGELQLKLSFFVTILHKKTTNWTSNRIVIVRRKYIFEVETPPHHLICRSY